MMQQFGQMQNPQQAFMNFLQNNPNYSAIASLAQNPNLKTIAENMARTNGINLNELINNLMTR